MTKKTSRTSRSRQRVAASKPYSTARRVASLLGLLLLGGLIVGLLALGTYTLHLDSIIRTQFEGKRWALPARVYARPLELFPGMALSAEQFASELALLNYRAVETPIRPGTYARQGELFELTTRRFSFWDGTERSRRMQVAFQGKSLKGLSSLDDQATPGLVRMEPAEIAGIYPAHQEDRILIKREEIPPVLVDALLAVEDRSFYEHQGIDFKGISRALIANIRAGRTVQGGSTLTQQLVKNFFLSNERTLSRKLNEMLMAVLIEWHYGKDEILEAYGNEVYLGQDGNRAIHGLGLASRFYFDRPLGDLDLHHIALLVGLVRGPSYYDPRRHPERAKQRRALVLDVMAAQALISPEDAATAKQLPLEVSPKAPNGISRYPAFLDLVQRQLREDYREEDLTSEGLQIFTTLDPQVQAMTEKAIIDRLPSLEKQVRLDPEQLQGAAIVADTQSGEVLAIVGGRDVRLAGFNRALDARRPVGSMLKPAIYLTALEHPNLYTLATLLDDQNPLVYTARNGKQWSPANYDKRYHGYVMLQDALAHSYNIPTARLGLELDVLKVIETLHRLGIKRELRPLPSLLLGAVDLTPLELTQMYETFASGGFRLPLRAIREVTAADGEPLQRYPLSVEKAIEPGPAYLITTAMQRVIQIGTARAINSRLSPQLGIAGKTGTTDDLRDSWFAGFSGNLLSVIWLGRDDNQPIRLNGASGAMRVWMEIMGNLPLEPLYLAPPPSIERVLIDPQTGFRADGNCPNVQSLPFLVGSSPSLPAPCSTAFFYHSTTDYRADDSGNHGEAGSDHSGNFFRRLLE